MSQHNIFRKNAQYAQIPIIKKQPITTYAIESGVAQMIFYSRKK